MAESPAVPTHIAKPHLRNFQPLPVEKDGQRLAGLRDPTLISQQMLVLPAPALQLVARFDGSQTLDELSRAFGVPKDALTDLARKLDEIGMLWGPTYEGMERSLREKLQSAGHFPSPHANQWGADESECRRRLESLLADAEDPELESPVLGLVAPHLDPERADAIYAAAYRSIAGGPRPDRVIVLGTNHYGVGDGVTTTRLGFATPLGVLPSDAGFLDRLEAALGDRLSKDELDHFGEHSIQLQLPWIRHLFGEVPIVAALVPDPCVPMLSDDGARVSTREFVAALAEAMRDVAGRSLVVASSDLSHVGPQFGDPKPVDEARQDEVERHDREMLSLFMEGSPERFVEAFAGEGNPTRWCSVGSMATALEVLHPSAVELIDYRGSLDPRRLALVSCAAVALLGPES